MPSPKLDQSLRRLDLAKKSLSLALPLVFDLDGTLIATDLVVESLLLFLKRNPLRVLVVIGWLLGGRANLKRKLAEAVRPDFETLPLREDVVAYAQAQAETGREVFIATAADIGLAEGFAQRRLHRGDRSDGKTNLKSATKEPYPLRALFRWVRLCRRRPC